MPTNVIHSIGTGGDYTTIAAWEAAQQGDFVSADEVHIGELANETYTEQVSILGATTDATRKWILRAAAGAENGGDRAAGALIISTGTGTTMFVRDDADIDDLRIHGPSTQNATTLQPFQFDGNTTVHLHRCIVSNDSLNDVPAISCGNQSTSALSVETCLVGPSGGWGISCTGASATVNVRNTDAVDCNAMSSNFRGGFDAAKANITYTNCVGYNNSNADFYNTGSTLINCASSDATAHGTSPVTGITSADFVNAVGGDYHLSAASNLRGAGTNLIGDIDVDIDGDAWPTAGAWDIGFDYYVGAGADHSLTVTSVESSSNVSTPVVVQVHALTSTGAESASNVSEPVLGQVQALTINGADSAAAVDTPQFFQAHGLIVTGAESASSVSAPVASLNSANHNLAADDSESASDVSAPAVNQVHLLLSISTESSTSITNPNLAQTHTVFASGLDATSDISSPVVNQAQSLISISAASAAVVSAPNIWINSADHNLLTDHQECLSEVNAPGVGQVHLMGAADLQALTDIGNPGLAQVQALLAGGIQMASNVSSPGLGIPSAVTPYANLIPVNKIRTLQAANNIHTMPPSKIRP